MLKTPALGPEPPLLGRLGAACTVDRSQPEADIGFEAHLAGQRKKLPAWMTVFSPA
ncbi:hypothetical protein [Ruegeria atlantica]|uniref:hypothetical protein n=1 Tax=Ruegeria atlantica TaxID=81569 RepID=UPI0024958684|nr:hypothetical protein [Ruegeria atlantica]